MMTSLLEDFQKVVSKFSDKFEFKSLNTDNYLKTGFKGILKIKIPLRVTQKSFEYRNARLEIIEDELYVQGFLNDIEYLLSMIE